MRSFRLVLAVLVALPLIVAGCTPRGCSSLKSRLRHRGATPPTSSHAASSTPPARVVVPRIDSAPTLDGKLDEDVWIHRSARSGPFHDEATGGDAIPYSDARFLRDDRALYVALYAADEDLRAKVETHDGPVWLDDAFDLRFSAPGAADRWVIDVSVAGVVTDVHERTPGSRDPSWESGITLGVAIDETLNDSTDNDEEWVVESRIPLASLPPGDELVLAVRRCDTPKGARRRCAVWSGTLLMK
jgi:hypothetical protein